MSHMVTRVADRVTGLVSNVLGSHPLVLTLALEHWSVPTLNDPYDCMVARPGCFCIILNFKRN
jgi:hypothetical protein